MKTTLRLIVAAGSCAVALGARAAPPPIEAYGRLPSVEDMALSPDGDRYAFVAQLAGQRRVVAQKLDGKILSASALGFGKVRGLRWAGEDLILLLTSHTEDGGPVVKLEPIQPVVIDLKTNTARLVFDEANRIVPEINGDFGIRRIDGRWYAYYAAVTYARDSANNPYESFAMPDLYRVDLETGALKIAATGTEFERSWVVGPDGAIAARVDYNPESQLWRLTTGRFGGDRLIEKKAPLAEIRFMGEGRTPGTAVLLDETGDDDVLEEQPLTVGAAPTPLFPGMYRPGMILDPATGLLIGARGEDHTLVSFEPKLASRFAAAQKALAPRQVSLTSFSSSFDRMIVETEGAGDSGSYRLVDIPAKVVKQIALRYPDIDEKDVGDSRMFTYQAADGLALDGVLTLPPGKEAKNLPVVVMPHGGPLGFSDQAGFDWWAQAFASRGYAVFQPNYRGSGGHSHDLYMKGFGQWGRGMQTDASDGLAALAAKGVVDPRRACIVGASYGGYAALAGVTIQHGLYRCAVSYGGVFDLRTLLDQQSDYSSNSLGLRYLRKAFGVKSNGDPLVRELSPIDQAAKADAPVLLIHGKDDTVVDIAQSRRMEHALKAAGKSVELVVLAGQDHWLSREETRIAMLKASVDFVVAHNPPG